MPYPNETTPLLGNRTPEQSEIVENLSPASIIGIGAGIGSTGGILSAFAINFGAWVYIHSTSNQNIPLAIKLLGGNFTLGIELIAGFAGGAIVGAGLGAIVGGARYACTLFQGNSTNHDIENPLVRTRLHS